MPIIGLAIVQKVSNEVIVLSINSLVIGKAKLSPSPSTIAVVIQRVVPLISSRGHQLLPGFAWASV